MQKLNNKINQLKNRRKYNETKKMNMDNDEEKNKDKKEETKSE